MEQRERKRQEGTSYGTEREAGRYREWNRKEREAGRYPRTTPLTVPYTTQLFLFLYIIRRYTCPVVVLNDSTRPPERTANLDN